MAFVMPLLFAPKMIYTKINGISKLLFMLQSPMQRLAIAASEIAKKKESEEVA